MNSDELDRILDDALASYSLREPRAGLPARVMARVRSEGAVSRGWWWCLAVAAAVLACVAIAIRPRPATLAPPEAAKGVEQVLVEQVPVPPRRDAPRREAHARRMRSLPRRESFPSPAPLTPEERALVALVQQAPEAARQLAQPDRPLEIEAINIPPLQMDGLQIGELK